ncbi:hypothetical protein CY34DRAFT_337604 [Suillus luteus UH-Slu-Lm8-n1]|uniref:Uncharacterized protein n=1 Tax=Suillus luteus UH-Slu-Lm8-n1 TaxID=930992 RepID=A0A0D0AYK0_9AGAM|nr:hypothetical protein CY34DRAFT_337604 [Suillus luteus UH-Slu-Lm8-n1]
MVAALKQSDDQVASADDANTKSNVKFKGHPAREKQQANTRGSARYGNDFFSDDANHAPHYAPPASSSSLVRWRHLLGPIRFGTRPANVLQTIPREPRQWNFTLFSVGGSNRIVDVAPGRKKNRIAIAPPTKAELDAAIQRANGNEADGSMRPGQLVPGIQGSQGRPTQIQTQTQGSAGVTEVDSYEVNCCGLLFSCRRSTPHRA